MSRELVQGTESLSKLKNARVLENFSNLNNEQEIEYFRHNYPDFLPEHWWDGKSFKPVGGVLIPEPRWEHFQRILRETWQEKFPAKKTVELIAGANAPEFDAQNLHLSTLLTKLEQSNPNWRERLKHATEHHEEFRLPPNLKLTNVDFQKTAIKLDALNVGRVETWPYQLAIMFLAIEPWRAKFCVNCGNRFVASVNARKNCSVDCGKTAHKQSKRNSYHLHKNEWPSTKKVTKTRSTKRKGGK